MLKLINGEWKPYKFKTKEEAIEAHRALWDSIAVKCEVNEVDSLYELMETFEVYKETILRDELNLREVYCDCPCCDWAVRQLGTFSNRCKECPLDWGIDVDKAVTPCLHIPLGDGWEAGYDNIDPKLVRDLKEKE